MKYLFSLCLSFVLVASLAQSNQYLHFDGVDDYAQVEATNGFGTGGTAPICTLSMWANISRKAGGGVQYQQLAGFRNDSNFSFFFSVITT